jgi:nucleotide-binding universal stress UspA family protein
VKTDMRTETARRGESRRARRVLVVANESADSDELQSQLHEHVVRTRAEVLVVAPVLSSRLRHWLSDEDAARGRAERRVVRCVERLRLAGLPAEGIVGDADPVQAIADALALFDADVLVIATHPAGRSNWLARDLVGRARARFRLPIVHVVVGRPLHAAA